MTIEELKKYLIAAIELKQLSASENRKFMNPEQAAYDTGGAQALDEILNYLKQGYLPEVQTAEAAQRFFSKIRKLNEPD